MGCGGGQRGRRSCCPGPTGEAAGAGSDGYMRHSIFPLILSLLAPIVLVQVQGFISFIGNPQAHTLVLKMGDDGGWSAVATKRSGAPIAAQRRQQSRNGTIYITVGPQCAGKTTAVSQVLNDNGGVDVTIDDQALVYIKVPTDYFLRNATGYKGGITTNAYPPETESIFGKSVKDRVKVSEMLHTWSQ